MVERAAVNRQVLGSNPSRGANYSNPFSHLFIQFFTSMYIVYVLCSQSTGKHYTGQTEDIDLRLLKHANGFSRYTRGRGPWNLVHSEEYPTRASAMQREKFLKSGKGRQWLKEKLSGRACPPEAD